MNRRAFLKRFLLGAATLTLAAKLRIDPRPSAPTWREISTPEVDRYLAGEFVARGDAMALREDGKVYPLRFEGETVGKVIGVNPDGTFKFQLLDTETARNIHRAIKIGARLKP